MTFELSQKVIPKQWDRKWSYRLHASEWVDLLGFREYRQHTTIHQRAKSVQGNELEQPNYQETVVFMGVCPVPRSMSYRPCPFVKFVSPHPTKHFGWIMMNTYFVILFRGQSLPGRLVKEFGCHWRQVNLLDNHYHCWTSLSQNGFAALHSACQEGHERVAKMLLQAGASLEQETKVGWGVSQDWVHTWGQAVDHWPL